MAADGAAAALASNTTTIVESLRLVPVAFDFDEQLPWLRYAFLAISIATGLIVALSSGVVYSVLSKRIEDRLRKKRRADQANELGSGSESDDDVAGDTNQLNFRTTKFTAHSRTRALEDENRVLRKRMSELEQKLSALQLPQSSLVMPTPGGAASGSTAMSPPRPRGSDRSAIMWSASPAQQRGISPAQNDSSSGVVLGDNSPRYIVRRASNPRQ
jgi:hypothetical protein